MTVGFGIIGCGMISQFHCRAIEEIRGAKVTGCFDMYAPAADRLAPEGGCTPHQKLRTLLADDAVDIVTICTPSGAHMEPAMAAAKAGKHVIIEKPLEITLKRCDRIIQACDEAGVVLSTIFPSRFHESAQLLKKAVEKGRFGKLALGDAYVKWFRSQAYYDSGAWRGTWKLDGGGALMNQAIHSVDLLTWLMGPVADLSARCATIAHRRIQVEDAAVAALRFENGALGTIEATTAAHPGYLKKIELYGSTGSAVMEEEDIKIWEFEKTLAADAAILKRMAGKTKTGGGAADPTAIGHHGHLMQFKDVLKAVKQGKTATIDGHEGRRSVEIILAIYKAAETGRTIQFPLKSDPVLAARKSD